MCVKQQCGLALVVSSLNQDVVTDAAEIYSIFADETAKNIGSHRFVSADGRSGYQLLKKLYSRGQMFVSFHTVGKDILFLLNGKINFNQIFFAGNTNFYLISLPFAKKELILQLNTKYVEYYANKLSSFHAHT
jgi:hypothetical protein